MPDWLTPQQAAAYLHVTRQTIYRWCDEGRLPFYELDSGGGRRFKREDLDAMLKPGQPTLRELQRQMADNATFYSGNEDFRVVAVMVREAKPGRAPIAELNRFLDQAEASNPPDTEHGRLIRLAAPLLRERYAEPTDQAAGPGGERGEE